MEAASDFAQLELRFVDQIQWRYELIRPLILFENQPATHRAQETHTRHRITPDGFYRGKKVIEKPAADEGQE